jgi:ribonuclease PH
MRPDGRKPDALRPVKIVPDFLRYAHGSALIDVGNTRVLCAVMAEDGVPPFLMNRGKGWVTAEYEMLPASTLSRKHRNWRRGKADGRTLEIQRLIGRALRSVVKPEFLGERTLWVDCDVLQADGGTRTASLTGAYVALALCVHRLLENGTLKRNPLCGRVAAVSAGIYRGRAVLDLNYEEDMAADVDLNLVMTDAGQIVEIQGTAEGAPFSDAQLKDLLALGRQGIRELLAVQREVLPEGVADHG